MQYRFEFTQQGPINHPQIQYQAPNIPANWDDNLPYSQQRAIVRTVIQHLIGNPAFTGYRDITDVYSFYDDDYELHKCEHEVTHRERFIDCWITPNYLFRYWL